MKPPLKVLVTGGPTRAYLDDIRFLTNLSSGELAFHLCQRLVEKRFRVEAVIGPSAFPFHYLKLKHLSRVETNQEMLERVVERCRIFRPDVVVFSAAVLDFVPARKLKGKVSSKKNWSIGLKPSPKIVDVVREKFPNIKRIGFKLEVKPLAKEALIGLGKKVMKEKELSALCLNFSNRISSKNHEAWIFDSAGNAKRFQSKKRIAERLAELIHRPEV